MVKFGSEYLLKNVYKKVNSSAKENNDFLKKINHLCLNDKSIDSIVNNIFNQLNSHHNNLILLLFYVTRLV